MKAASPKTASRVDAAIIETDFVLLQQLEELGSGQTVHRRANLSAAYRCAMQEYKRTGDEDFRVIAAEAHGELRRMLAVLRQATFSPWARFSCC